MKKITIAVSFLFFLLTAVYCQEKDGAGGLEFLSRAPSFSFVIFEGKLTAEVKGILKENEYTAVGAKNVKGPYGKVMEMIEAPTDGNNIVRKGVFERNKYTVLLDPERVVFLFEESLLKVAKAKKARIYAAIWERASKTIVFMVFSPEGIAAKNVFIGDDADAGNTNPDAILAKSKDGGGLVKALVNRGLPLSDIFSNELQVEILTLKE